MKPPRSTAADSVDAAYAALRQAGERAEALRAFLDGHGSDFVLLLGVLRRPASVRLLEMVATTEPWSRDQRLLGAVVLNPRAPRALSLRLVSSLLWRELAEVAASLRVDAAVRVRAEGLLREQLPDLRLGERISLARLATPTVLPDLLADAEPMVLEAALLNPRLGEEMLVQRVRSETALAVLLEAVAGSVRWRDRYGVRVALAQQPRTPLAVALAQLSALLPRDLERVGAAEGVRPLVQMAALRLARERPILTPREGDD